MPFGLTNANASLQNFINDVLRPFLNLFVTAYLDDILIFSDPERTQTARPAKVAIVVDWGTEKPETMKAHKPALGKATDVRRFLEFANFYRRFIKDYSRIIPPLIRLTCDEVPFVWGDDCKKAIETLKVAFTTAAVLCHFGHDGPTIVETDASDFASAGALSQHDDCGVLQPVAFFSEKNSPAEHQALLIFEERQQSGKLYTISPDWQPAIL